ncbi:hypothetical protein F8566_00320 [Actinomadura rudentiformis]|uniref:Uncharacterized protein n=2 Tax=Actinomadura rudentiformis TaxID=359158 RepID=A0A6H9Z5X9_9ACTN|nr:hypothetical protein F8566_00320 [Actinomadura rudentiformis]
METILLGLLERMDAENLAYVCETLVWNVEDNGAEIMAVCRSWLTGSDPALIEAALTVNDGLLFRTRDEMSSAFTRLAERHPQFAPRTTEILRNWDDHTKPKAVQDVLQGTWPLETAARIYGITEDQLRTWINETR